MVGIQEIYLEGETMTEVSESFPIDGSCVCPMRVLGSGTLCYEGYPFRPYVTPIKRPCRAWFEKLCTLVD